MIRLTRKKTRAKIKAPAEALIAPDEQDDKESEMHSAPAAAHPAIIPTIPAVYGDDGYLVLTLSTRKGEVHYLSTRDGGGSHHMPFPRFMATARVHPVPCNPYRLALNMLARKRVGTLSIRARDERKLLSMLKASREELLKLEPDKLGVEYARIVGKSPPEATTKDKMIKEILMTIEQQVAKEEKKEEKAPAAAGEKKDEKKPAAKKPAAKKPEAKKKPAAKKPEAKKAPAAKKPEAKKAPAAKKPEAKKAPAAKKEKNPDNPYRPGSMKANGYDFFKKSGGDREKVVAHLVKLGTTETTAKSWYSVFCRV